jgi:tRNA A37 threonylcarbamoyladenosine synthetase subunit TsaC/SUA5/YrdC
MRSRSVNHLTTTFVTKLAQNRSLLYTLATNVNYTMEGLVKGPYSLVLRDYTGENNVRGSPNSQLHPSVVQFRKSALFEEPYKPNFIFCVNH